MPRLKGISGPLRASAPQRLKPPPKQAESHYRTPEHRAWSAKVIQAAGGMCQDCGRSGVRLFADHVHELRDGGDPFGQGRAICGACHTRVTAARRAARHGGRGA